MKRDGTQLASDTLHYSRPQPIDLPQSLSSDYDVRRQKRQSLRLRPSEILENAEPPSPLRDTSLKSVPTSTASSKMSLFHLFSRPKVERARGHTEKGLDAPAVSKRSGNALKTSASTPNLVVRVQSDAAIPPTPSLPPTPASGPKTSTKIKFKEPAKPSIRERKAGSFEPPPLFQAYPQSMKDGTLELSTMSVESVQQKSRSKKAGVAQADDRADAASEDTSSLDNKRSTMAHLKHVANGSVAQVELPRKIFVLVTSGYLLQYAETGPSDRLPERMLHLGKESAAFACDLVPGKHYVLQVSQAVDEEGIVVINSGSILSKLGIRTAAAKRMTSNLLLVMPDAREMESWMTAIRREIEVLGGTKMQPTRHRSASRSEGVDLKKTPSQSHRYKVQRHPDMVTPLTPTETPPPVPSPSPKPEHDISDTATIDGIEMEASKLTEDDPRPRLRTRSPSDSPSVESSAAISVDQQQLDNLRSSGSNKRFSRASQAPTVATTVTNSRANSLTGSPPSEGFPAGNLETVQQNVSRPTYRILSSYSTRRRSAAPASVLKDSHVPPSVDTSPQKAQVTTIEQPLESPVVGQHSIGLATGPLSAQGMKRLSLARSEPNLQSSARDKHDSKMPTPIPPLPHDPEKERPESFVGELPSSAAWSTTRAANRRASMLQSASAMTAQAASSPVQVQAPSAMSPAQVPKPQTPTEPTRPKRMSAFSIPLKVNPSTPAAQPISSRSRRRSSVHDPDPPGETPVVHALTATVEPSRRASVAHASINGSGLQKSPSQRLSLFPTQLSSPPPLSGASTGATQASAQANQRTLRRPTSMQVRSDHAPFLSSVRNSAGPPAVRNFTAPAVPIRGLKPSRSASNVTALANTSGTAMDNALKDLDFGLPPPKEDDDKPMPLPAATPRSQSPLPPPSRSGSRLSVQKGIKTRSSLPELDLGIPVVGLGPPAPPPSAPLPPPPTQSRPGSRMGSSRSTSPSPVNGSPNGGIDQIARLGIRVS